MKKLLPLFVILLLWSCSEQSSKTIITGNSRTLAGRTIYLKKYSHFDYLEEYMIDSTVVAPDGKFAFSLQVDDPELVTLSTTKRPPHSYIILRDMPEDYYNSFCENFFGVDPVLYVQKGADYNITDWNPEMDVVSYGDNRHNLLRIYYKGIDFRKHLKDVNRIPLQMDAGKAWGMVSAQRDSVLADLELPKEFENESFENYLRTEIELGAVNEFLLWNYHQSESPLKGEQLEQIMETYNKGNWNPNSIELYKLTERYISHQMNEQNGQNLAYYEPDAEKIAMAEKYADPGIREKFIRNMKMLMEQGGGGNGDNKPLGAL